MNRPPGPPHRMEWVASPPGGDRSRPRRRRPSEPYAGPPSYPAVPRWGFPTLTWRWPLALPTGGQADPVQRVASLGATAVSTLWVTAVLAGFSALAEGWRYVLLLRSRGEALPQARLAVSDALVATTGILTWLLGVLCGVTVVLWALRARALARDRAGTRDERRDWQVVAGVLVPGLNLVVPGSVLAELEHTALAGEGAREPAARPEPTRLVVAWWAAWAATLLLGWLTFAWSFRDGVQALADGVLLHFWNNVAVVVAAVLTVHVVKYVTALLTPPDPTALRRMRVLDASVGSSTERAPRPEGVRR